MAKKSKAYGKIYSPNVVMSIHGYNSLGEWQKTLADVLSTSGLKSAQYNYGRKIFRILSFNINTDVLKFRDWYLSKINDKDYELEVNDPFQRPSIMAHSLGTWIIAKALQKYPEIKFDKIFLFGSIIPSNFDWYQIILNDQVNSVIYEKAEKDWVVSLACIITRNTNPSSTTGFIQKSSFIHEVKMDQFGHSDFQYKAHLSSHIKNTLKEKPHELIIKRGSCLDFPIIKKNVETCLQIDRNAYDQLYNQTPISIKIAYGWLEVEQDIWTFLQNSRTKEIIGYINAVPVNDIIYKQFVDGNLKEQDILSEHILEYKSCNKYNLLILSIALKKGSDECFLHKGRRAELLILASIYKIQEYAKQNIMLSKIAALAWTPEGKRLCEGFCMTKVSADESGHDIYEIDVNELHKIDLSAANMWCKWWYTSLLKKSKLK